MMLPSRRLVATFICVFVLGAFAGGFLSMSFADLRFYNFLNRTNDPTGFAARLDDKLAREYQLDADERTRIAPLTREMAQNLYQLRRKFASDVLATIAASHEKIAGQMTPSQRDAYQKANEDRRKRAVSMLMPETAPASGSSHSLVPVPRLFC
jgi:hypothetical protein